MSSQLRQRSLILLILLAAQFVLGMLLNVFVTLPAKHPGQSGNYFVRSGHSFGWAITLGGGVVLFLHVLVAIGLLVNSLILLIQAVKAHHTLWGWIATVGLVSILAAFSNGLAFLDFNRSISSFIMAMGYIMATTAYTAGLCITFSTSQRARS